MAYLVPFLALQGFYHLVCQVFLGLLVVLDHLVRFLGHHLLDRLDQVAIQVLLALQDLWVLLVQQAPMVPLALQDLLDLQAQLGIYHLDTGSMDQALYVPVSIQIPSTRFQTQSQVLKEYHTVFLTRNISSLALTINHLHNRRRQPGSPAHDGIHRQGPIALSFFSSIFFNYNF